MQSEYKRKPGRSWWLDLTVAEKMGSRGAADLQRVDDRCLVTERGWRQRPQIEALIQSIMYDQWVTRYRNVWQDHSHITARSVPVQCSIQQLANLFQLTRWVTEKRTVPPNFLMYSLHSLIIWGCLKQAICHLAKKIIVFAKHSLNRS